MAEQRQNYSGRCQYDHTIAGELVGPEPLPDSWTMTCPFSIVPDMERHNIVMRRDPE